MDAAIADTINRMDAQRIAKHLDLVDWFSSRLPGDMRGAQPRWCDSSIANTLMSENAATNADRAWLVGALASRTPDAVFDGEPADGDWENMFSHLRAEILARRGPESPHAGTAETQRRVVV